MCVIFQLRVAGTMLREADMSASQSCQEETYGTHDITRV